MVAEEGYRGGAQMVGARGTFTVIVVSLPFLLVISGVLCRWESGID